VTDLRRTTGRVVALVVAAAYAGGLAVTEPFTTPADVVTACGVAGGAVALVLSLTGRRDGSEGVEVTGSAAQALGPTSVRGALPWVVLAVAVVGWEVFCYFGAPRSAHPTISSIYDTVAGWRAAKAVVVLAWLGLGWELVR